MVRLSLTYIIEMAVFLTCSHTHTRTHNLSRESGLIATLAGKVHFVDFIQQREVYTLSLPNAVIEAMAAGLPVVTTPVGGIPCLVESGRNGLLVPPRDPQKLADAIGTLLRDEPLRRRMGLENQRQIEREHDLEHVWPRVAAMLTG